MNKFASGFVATALAASFTAASFVPVNAAPLEPLQVRPAVSDTASNIQDVQYKWRRNHSDRGSYWRGHHGSRHWRPGYRRHGDFWFPLAAFATGAIISGAIANDRPPAYRGGNAHVRWCYDRYRSYRASDNTFQPYNGPRRQCVSPY